MSRSFLIEEYQISCKVCWQYFRGESEPERMVLVKTDAMFNGAHMYALEGVTAEGERSAALAAGWLEFQLPVKGGQLAWACPACQAALKTPRGGCRD